VGKSGTAEWWISTIGMAAAALYDWVTASREVMRWKISDSLDDRMTA
jgi:hypothetical protein